MDFLRLRNLRLDYLFVGAINVGRARCDENLSIRVAGGRLCLLTSSFVCLDLLMDLWRRLFPRLSICLFTDYGFIYLLNRLPARARVHFRVRPRTDSSARSILFAAIVCLNHFYLLIHARSTFCHYERAARSGGIAECVHHDNTPRETSAMSQTIAERNDADRKWKNGERERETGATAAEQPPLR